MFVSSYITHNIYCLPITRIPGFDLTIGMTGAACALFRGTRFNLCNIFASNCTSLSYCPGICFLLNELVHFSLTFSRTTLWLKTRPAYSLILYITNRNIFGCVCGVRQCRWAVLYDCGSSSFCSNLLPTNKQRSFSFIFFLQSNL